jgi:hypothetical protein
MRGVSTVFIFINISPNKFHLIFDAVGVDQLL